MTDDEIPQKNDDAGDPAPGPPAHLAGLSGMDLVRRTLEEARGAARSQGRTSAAAAPPRPGARR